VQKAIAAVTDGHVVLILLLQLQTCRQLTPAMKRHILHGLWSLHQQLNV